MISKVAKTPAEQRQLQSIDDASYRINDSSGEQQYEFRCGQHPHKLCERKGAHPAQCDIDYRGHPARTTDPQKIHEHAEQGSAADREQHEPAGAISQRHKAHRRVASGNHNKNHHVIQLLQHAVHPRGYIKEMVGGARPVEQYKAHRENEEDLQLSTARMLRHAV